MPMSPLERVCRLSGWKLQKRKLVDAAWVLLQSLALLAILFTPIWIPPTPGSLSERFKKIKHIDEVEGGERRPTSITSRVLTIPGSGFRKNIVGKDEWSESLEAETRQVRFEWALGSESSEEWRLSAIERKNPEGVWEQVSLVWNESGSPIGSVYVELAQGENLFAAQVVSSKTRAKKKILLNVAQKR
jgi:hypothetical protein